LRTSDKKKYLVGFLSLQGIFIFYSIKNNYMKKKPNVEIGIIINIALTVLSIVYMFVYHIEQNGFQFNYNSLEFFIYLFIFYIFPFILGVNFLFFLFYSFFYKWARIGLVITLLMAVLFYLLKIIFLYYH